MNQARDDDLAGLQVCRFDSVPLTKTRVFFHRVEQKRRTVYRHRVTIVSKEE